MEIVYCSEWSLFKKKPHKILSEHDAYCKHSKGECYVAVLYEEKAVKNVVEIDENSLTVRFYDENLNNHLLYGFIKKGANKIFLNTVYHYTYKDRNKIEHILFNFKENGEMFIEKRNLISGEVEEKEDIVDISCNWDAFPEFGDYSSLVRIERE